MKSSKKQMKLNQLFFSIIALLLLSGCFINSKYHKANNLYKEGNYVNAIKYYDQFIAENPQSPYSTKSALERSKCYFELGKRAYNKENWTLAKRLFQLSNSDEADDLLDNCLFNLAKIELAKQDTLTAMNYYNYIFDNLKNSELLPVVIYNKIKLHYAKQEFAQIIKDYNYLWKNHPDSEYVIKSLFYIDKILPNYLNKIALQLDNKKYDEALESLQELQVFPSSLDDEINNLLAKTYYLKAELAFANMNYEKSYQLYNQAKQYSQKYEKQTKNRINEICDSFIKQGENFLAQEQFDKAIETFKKIFIFQKNHEKANNEIANAKKQKTAKIEARKLFEQATELHNDEKYKEALALFEKSNNLYPNSDAKDQIFIIKNILRADKEPEIFAKDIIFEYKDGKLVKNVYAIQDSLVAVHGHEEVRTSEWKVLYSFGKYKYEVRYDILTPAENYYFIWQIDLKNRKISALNKLSEKVL